MRSGIGWGAACALAFAACIQAEPPASNGPAQLAVADTLRGTVEIVGAEPVTAVTLGMEGGGRGVVLEGERWVLEQLQGLEVVVWGEHVRHREGGWPAGFRVDRVAVRAADGVPAVDGTLMRDGDGYVVVTVEGARIRVLRVPEPLRARVGQRVWLAGPPDGPVASYGVIEARTSSSTQTWSRPWALAR